MNGGFGQALPLGISSAFLCLEYTHKCAGEVYRKSVPKPLLLLILQERGLKIPWPSSQLGRKWAGGSWVGGQMKSLPGLHLALVLQLPSSTINQEVLQYLEQGGSQFPVHPSWELQAE